MMDKGGIERWKPWEKDDGGPLPILNGTPLLEC